MLLERRGVFKGPLLVVNVTVCVSELHRNETCPSSTAFVWLTFQKLTFILEILSKPDQHFFRSVGESVSHSDIYIYFFSLTSITA